MSLTYEIIIIMKARCLKHTFFYPQIIITPSVRKVTLAERKKEREEEENAVKCSH